MMKTKFIFPILFLILLVLSACSTTPDGYSARDVLTARDDITGEELRLDFPLDSTRESEDGTAMSFVYEDGIDALATALNGAVTAEKDTLYLVKKSDKRAVFRMATYEGGNVYFCLTNTEADTFVIHPCTVKFKVDGEEYCVAFPYHALNDDSVFTSLDLMDGNEFSTDKDYFEILEYYRSLGVYSIVEGVESFELAAAYTGNETYTDDLPIAVAFGENDNGATLIFTPGHCEYGTEYAEG